MKNLIVIAIATYRRPVMLNEALESLKKIELPKGYQAACYICDNDPEKSAEKICYEFKSNCPLEVHYYNQTERGIVHTRNLLLEKADQAEAQYIAFFDDDETVSTNWLISLVQTATEYEAQSVSGSVIYLLPENAAEWLKKRNFYGGGRPKTGTQLKGASTNNVLIDLHFLKKHNLSFNLDFNMSGGSDSFLFREIKDHGGKIVSCQEAIAYEQVPTTRATEEWILNRAYKNGYTELTRNRIRHGKPTAYLIALGYGFWLALCYVFGLLTYPFINYSSIVFNRRRIRKIDGMLHAYKGNEYEEYRTIHGS